MLFRLAAMNQLNILSYFLVGNLNTPQAASAVNKWHLKDLTKICQTPIKKCAPDLGSEKGPGVLNMILDQYWLRMNSWKQPYMSVLFVILNLLS